MPPGLRAGCAPPPLALALALCSVCGGLEAARGSSSAAFRQAPAADGGQAVAAAEQAQWEAEGQMAVAQGKVVAVHAVDAQGQAESAAGEAAKASRGLGAIAAEADRALVAANSSLQRALAARDKAKTLIDGVEQRAYTAAKAAAEETAVRLEKEAEQYYDSMVAELRALDGAATTQSRIRAQVAAEASAPYKEATEKIKVLAAQYDRKVQDLVNEARTLAGEAAIATKAARAAQARGSAALAAQQGAEARNLASAADERRARAVRIRQIAETLHSYIPGYQQGAEMAAERALAVGEV